jgi:hypothetical protein
MVEMVNSPSTWVVSKSCLALWLVVSLTFAALILAAGAQARGTNAASNAVETSIGESATEGGAPPEQAAPVAEQAQPPAEPTPPPAEQAQPAAEPTPPPAEQAQPAAEPTPPPAEQAQPPAEPTPPPAEPTPPAIPQTPPTIEEAPPAVEDGSLKQTADEGTAEPGSDGLATEGTVGDSQVSDAASRPSHEDEPGEVAPEASSAVTTPAYPGSPPEIATSPVQSQPYLTLWLQEISAHRAGQVSCELDAIGIPITTGRTAGWLEISTASSVSTAPFAITRASPTAITTGVPAGNQDDRSAVDNHPSAPTPGPGPGGAGGGSAAGGGPGSAFSGSFTLADVLLQAGPRATRRLLLSQPSWRTSFLVLIPERPD